MRSPNIFVPDDIGSLLRLAGTAGLAAWLILCGVRAGAAGMKVPDVYACTARARAGTLDADAIGRAGTACAVQVQRDAKEFMDRAVEFEKAQASFHAAP
jgi:hypothetical protein